MSDPINDIFNGTPDGIDEDELKEMQAADAQRVADAEALKNENQEEMKPEPAKADLAPKPKEENKPMPVEDILAGKGPVAPGEAMTLVSLIVSQSITSRCHYPNFQIWDEELLLLENSVVIQLHFVDWCGAPGCR